MQFTALFFDLDETLYPAGNGLWAAIGERMSEFMYEKLNLPQEQIPGLRRKYYETYGTTLRGLQIHHGIDADEFLAFVHDLPLDRFIHADQALRALLLSLPQHKWVFTNADAPHARRVLEALGIGDCFSGIVDVRAVEFHCKPDVKAYRRALSLAGEPDPHRCVILDDAPRNLAPAHALGFFTILVGASQVYAEADRCIASLKELREGVPELWEDINWV